MCSEPLTRCSLPRDPDGTLPAMLRTMPRRGTTSSSSSIPSRTRCRTCATCLRCSSSRGARARSSSRTASCRCRRRATSSSRARPKARSTSTSGGTGSRSEINQPRRVVSASRGRSAPRRARPFRLLMGSGSHACLLSPSGRRGRDFLASVDDRQRALSFALCRSHCVGRRRRRPSLARGGVCVFFASTFAGVFFAHPFDWVQGGASRKTIEHIADEGEASCCFDRGDCSSRRHWRDLKEPEARPAVAVVVFCSPRPSTPLPARSLHDARPVGGLLYGTRVSLRE